MADTASLVARVKTEGAAAAAQQLDALAGSATSADSAVNKLTPDVGKLDKATSSAAKGGLSGFRNSAQQVGFQVQDLVVQLQSGTSAFVAIGQQGSQLAGAFGPGGAVLGAVIALASAVGGVLYKSMGDAKASTAELQAAQEALQKVLQQTKAGSFEVSDALQALVLSGASAAEVQAQLGSAHQAIKTQMEQSAIAVREATEATTSWWNGNAIGAEQSLKLGQEVSSLTGFLDGLSLSFGISSDEAKKLTPLLAAVQREANPENIAALAAETDRLVQTHGNENAELVKLNATLQQHATDTRNAEAAQKALDAAVANATKRINAQNEAIIKNVQIGNLADRDRIKAQAEADKQAFAEREGVTKDQIARFAAAKDEEAKQDLARIDKTEKDKADRLAKAEAKKAETAAKKVENEAKRQQKQADDFLSTLARQNQDELAAIDAQEQQKLEKLRQFNEQGNLTQQQFEDAKTQIVLDADTKRNELLQKQTEDRMKQQNSADSFIEQLRVQNEGELAEIDRQQEIKLQKLNDFYAKGLIAEGDYQKAIQDIQDEADKKRLDSYESTLSDTTSALKSSLGEGSALYKAAAITQTIIETYKGATAAYASLATIPIVGPGLGIAAAAAITAAGLANVGKIRAAREQGGQLSYGQVSTIAERGKPEVIMPAGASRVRTADQMRQLMGENGSKSSGGDSVVIVNNTTGRIDSATTERDDEGRLRVLIEEHVASSLQDSNSKISKSRRSTRNSPGF